MGSVTKIDEALQLPAHLAKHFAQSPNTDLSDGAGSGGYPVVSYKGKVWAVSKGGERMTLMNEEGDPRASINVVILKANNKLSKVWYESSFSEGSNEKPDCYSKDSIAPESDSPKKQAEKCAICPKNAWGSRVTDTGSKAKACSDSRRMAIADPDDISTPMLLRVPAASLRPLAEYAKQLDKRKVPYQAMVTKIGFNPDAAHPEFTFKPVRWLNEAEAEAVAELQDSDTVADILAKDVSYDNSVTEPAPKAEEPVDDFLPPKEEAPAKTVKPKATKPVVEAEPEPAKPAPSKVLVDTDSSLDDLLAAFDDLK